LKNLLFAILLTVPLLSCVSHNTVEQEQPAVRIKSIIILPVEIEADQDENGIAQIPETLITGKEILNKLISQYFVDHTDVRILSQEQTDSYSTNAKGKRAQSLAIASSNNSDAVMVWSIDRYIEREGKKYHADQPASVSFSFRMLQTDTGRLLCSGRFDETQKSWTDNLLSFQRVLKRGMTWITAEELANEGVTEKLNACQYLNKSK